METPAVTVAASAFDFQRDLSRYYRHARKQGELPLTTQGWIYKNNFKTFLVALNVPTHLLNNDEATNGKLWFMRRMLTHLREIQGDAFQNLLTVNLNSKLLSLPMLQRIKWVFDAWRDGSAWNELIRLPQSAGYDYRRDAPAALSKSRNIVLKTLTKWVPGRTDDWHSANEFVQHIKKNDYAFLFERRRGHGYGAGGLYASPYYGGNNSYGITFNIARDEASGWDVVERAFIVQLLTGPLHWMGLVDLGYNTSEPTGENNPPFAFRLTTVGAWLLGLAEPPQFVEGGGRVVVQPNFAILAMEPISDAVLIDLDHFADAQGGDRAITYELSRESLYRGQQSGWPAERVVAFLEKHQGGVIPPNVKRTLEEWETSHRRITFHRNKVVVQFSDDEAEAQASLSIARFKPRSLGGRFELIEKVKVHEVSTALRDAGWTPTAQMAKDIAIANSIRLDDDGVIHFTQPAPSVFVLGRLAEIAESPPHRVTAASVRAAMNRNMPSLDHLLSSLAEMNDGTLPPALEKNIRKWAGFFGSASMQNVTLLELSNLEVLTNLLNDEQVGKYLQPIEGSSRPLVVVDSARADEVKTLLIERGVVFE
jgi:hypothetical protein